MQFNRGGTASAESLALGSVLRSDGARSPSQVEWLGWAFCMGAQSEPRGRLTWRVWHVAGVPGIERKASCGLWANTHGARSPSGRFGSHREGDGVYTRDGAWTACR